MEVRLLGPLELLIDGRPVRLEAAKQRALLALLALHANEVVAADRIVDELWGERPPASAHKLVQTYVWQLRKLIGGALHTTPPGYLLAVPPEHIDSSRFERLLELGEATLDRGDAEAAHATLEEALLLWRGPALSDVAVLGFARREAERLDELRLSAHEARVEAELMLGRARELVAELSQLARSEPYRERTHAQLMLALYRCGRQADALEVYAGLRRTLRTELGLEPTPRLQELQQAILRHDTSLASVPRRRRGALPVPANRLIGRARELGALQRLLRRDDVRLVTLTGAGGSGKTRLALEAAAKLSSEFDDGAYFVDLAPLTDPALALPALADGIDLRQLGAAPLAETLRDHLADKQMLILLDNFEHLLPAAAEAAALLRAAPRLKLLVTSRAALHVSGEWELSLAPLDEPDAVALFAARAQAASVDFEPDDTVAAICRRIDNLPLAIELAAPQVRVIATSELLDRLAHRLPNLTQAPSDVPQRQQTVRATIDWSHGLLGASEQELLARLSVFAAGFTLDAAGAVADATFDGIAALVDQSLIQRTGDRLSMLETIREYAAERLAHHATSDVEEHTVQLRHALYFLTLAEEAAPHLEMGAGDPTPWLDRIEADHDNFRAAFDFFDAAGNVELEQRLAAALSRFWHSRGYYAEARRRLDSALKAGAEATGERARAAYGAGMIAGYRGDNELAERMFTEALRIFESLGDRFGTARVRQGYGMLAVQAGDYQRGRALLADSVATFAELGHENYALWCTRLLAWVHYELGELAQAREIHEEVVGRARAIGSRQLEADSLGALGGYAVIEGRLLEAAALLQESTQIFLEIGDPELAMNLCRFARALALAERPDAGAQLLACGEAVCEKIGRGLDSWLIRFNEQTAALIHQRLDAADYERAREDGKKLTPESALELALAQLPGTSARVPVPPAR